MKILFCMTTFFVAKKNLVHGKEDVVELKHNQVYGLHPGGKDESITMNKNKVYELTKERFETGYEI